MVFKCELCDCAYIYYIYKCNMASARVLVVWLYGLCGGGVRFWLEVNMRSTVHSCVHRIVGSTLSNRTSTGELFVRFTFAHLMHVLDQRINILRPWSSIWFHDLIRFSIKCVLELRSIGGTLAITNRQLNYNHKMNIIYRHTRRVYNYSAIQAIEMFKIAAYDVFFVLWRQR